MQKIPIRILNNRFYRPLLFSLLTLLPSFSDAVPLIELQERFHPVEGEHGMVVTQDVIATQIGLDILKKGGNAVDAAVAVGFALAVILPRAGNIGGGGFMLVWVNKEHKAIAINYREKAPLKATPGRFT